MTQLRAHSTAVGLSHEYKEIVNTNCLELELRPEEKSITSIASNKPTGIRESTLGQRTFHRYINDYVD